MKLRNMILGMEKKRKEDKEEIDSSAFTSTSHLHDSSSGIVVTTASIEI